MTNGKPARLGWGNSATGMFSCDVNTPEWKSFLGLDPNREFTYVSGSMFTSPTAYERSDRAIMPPRMLVRGSGALTVGYDGQIARCAIVVLHDAKDQHFNLWFWGWTPKGKPVCTREIQGHQLDDRMDIQLSVIADKDEKQGTITAQRT